MFSVIKWCLSGCRRKASASCGCVCRWSPAVSRAKAPAAWLCPSGFKLFTIYVDTVSISLSAVCAAGANARSHNSLEAEVARFMVWRWQRWYNLERVWKADTGENERLSTKHLGQKIRHQVPAPKILEERMHWLFGMMMEMVVERKWFKKVTLSMEWFHLGLELLRVVSLSPMMSSTSFFTTLTLQIFLIYNALDSYNFLWFHN